MNQPPAWGRRLVLVGGGHAHVLVLRAFADKPEPGLQLTLVAKDVLTPYSGMLPGHVAGIYPREALHIDLARLAAQSGARLIHDEAVGFDRAGKRVLLAGGSPVSYDVLSVDIGITPDLSGIAGAREHGLSVKPIGDFIAKWDRLRADGPRGVAILGGGVAGICLAFAVSAALRRQDRAGLSIALVSAAPPPELNARARRLVQRALRRRGVTVHRGEAVSIEPGAVTLADGRRIPADAVMVSTQAAPPPALNESGFARDERGFLAIRPTLQVVDEEDVFAAGDCATMIAHPRPKAGVFAVRQGPVLARNLRRRLRGQGLEHHVPQTQHLVLVATGDGRAIGSRGRWLAFEGRWVWALKDWIDRRFMRRFA